jgi:hypothetical protein
VVLQRQPGTGRSFEIYTLPKISFIQYPRHRASSGAIGGLALEAAADPSGAGDPEDHRRRLGPRAYCLGGGVAASVPPGVAAGGVAEASGAAGAALESAGGVAASGAGAADCMEFCELGAVSAGGAAASWREQAEASASALRDKSTKPRFIIVPR